ncbi:hypothetical protein FRB94_001182 [Tulasnella sp. JGI-2019a]|nr:hypothetical protein FRB94_001182 [Tulasnella sp. JGI-2019a]KAG8998463.1 hypothetical protein FRB93_013695 [Tulasnella sp. JGI-2019a]
MGDLSSLWGAMVTNGGCLQAAAPNVLGTKIGWLVRSWFHISHALFEVPVEAEPTESEIHLLET